MSHGTPLADRTNTLKDISPTKAPIVTRLLESMESRDQQRDDQVKSVNQLQSLVRIGCLWAHMVHIPINLHHHWCSYQHPNAQWRVSGRRINRPPRLPSSHTNPTSAESNCITKKRCIDASRKDKPNWRSSRPNARRSWNQYWVTRHLLYQAAGGDGPGGGEYPGWMDKKGANLGDRECIGM